MRAVFANSFSSTVFPAPRRPCKIIPGAALPRTARCMETSNASSFATRPVNAAGLIPSPGEQGLKRGFASKV